MYKKLHNWLIDTSLKTKLLLFNCLITLFIGISSFLAVNIFMKYNEELLYNTTASVLTFFSSEIGNSFDSMTTSSSVLIADNTIQGSLYDLKYSPSSLKTAVSYRSLYNSILSYSYTIPHVESICLYTPTSTIWSNNHQSSLSVSQLEYIKEYTDEQKGSPCFLVLDKYNNQLVLARQIRRIAGTNLEPLGTLVIFINTESLIKASTTHNTFDDCSYILSADAKTVYRSDAPTPENTFDILNDSYKVIPFKGHYYFVLKSMIPGYGWEFECGMNYDKTHGSILMGHMLFLLALACCIILSLLASGVLSQNISKHIFALVKKMKTFDSESDVIPQTNYDYSTRKDEIGIVHRNFDAMAREQQRLIRDNYQAEMLMKNAQLKALEQQINPHFLYNTLESINWLAKSKHETEISKIVESLGNLLHATLDSRSRMIPLEHELELIHNYITIQEFRFGDRLKFHLSIEQELSHIPIPKLSIQPLVENAIKYALEEIADECNIYITILHTEQLIYIYVKNDGSQFELGLLEKLRANPKNSRGFGIGLINIDTRIKLTYGENYGLDVYNENNKAVARISIPFIQDEMN